MTRLFALIVCVGSLIRAAAGGGPEQHAYAAVGRRRAGRLSSDSRELVRLPPPMQEHMLGNMRDHLVTLNEIVGDLADGKFDAAAKVSEQRLGMSSLSLHDAAHMAPFMPKPMQDYRNQHAPGGEPFGDHPARRLGVANGQFNAQCEPCASRSDHGLHGLPRQLPDPIGFRFARPLRERAAAGVPAAAAVSDRVAAHHAAHHHHRAAHHAAVALHHGGMQRGHAAAHELAHFSGVRLQRGDGRCVVGRLHHRDAFVGRLVAGLDPCP